MSGRTWVVTGGSGGIGGALVADLIGQGENVHVWDLEPPRFAGARFHHVDLTAEGSIEAAAEQVDQALHAFVHCAGISKTPSFHDPALIDSVRFVYEVHVVAFVRAFRALESRLRSGTGSVVAVTSAAQEVIYAGSLAYGASKMALDRVVRQLAVDFGGHGIRVNAVAPGAIATPMTHDAWSDPEYAAERRSYIPLGRQGEAKSVADAIRFLASDEAGYITGHTLWVDGGIRNGIFTKPAQGYLDS
jgi:NAD(P)-dependent dehydrogenase (short-subunit alcohol dehydrogenase family)